MKKLRIVLTALVCVVVMAGCTNWVGSGEVRWKDHFPEKVVHHRTAKGHVRHHKHPECWSLAVLDDEYRNHTRNKYASSEQFEENLKNKYTRTVCVSKDVWDITAVGSKITVKKENEHGN